MNNILKVCLYHFERKALNIIQTLYMYSVCVCMCLSLMYTTCLILFSNKYKCIKILLVLTVLLKFYYFNGIRCILSGIRSTLTGISSGEASS